MSGSEPIRHIVMWRVAGETVLEKQRAVAVVRSAFEEMRGVIPGMSSLEIGVDVSGVSYACDLVLVTQFDSRQALHDYAHNPVHLAVRDRLGGLRIARHQVDYVLATGEAQ